MKKEIKRIHKNQSELNELHKKVYDLLNDAFNIIYNEVIDDVENREEVALVKEKIWDAYSDLGVWVEFKEINND